MCIGEKGEAGVGSVVDSLGFRLSEGGAGAGGLLVGRVVAQRPGR